MATLSDVRKLVRESQPDDWHKIAEGPTYRSRFRPAHEVARLLEGPSDYLRLREESHDTIVVYTPDVDLTIAYGMSCFDPRNNPEFEWAQVFDDKSVHICYADIFWRGSLVDRLDYALVDGGRATLPIGGPDGLEVTSWQLDVARLLHNLDEQAGGAFDAFFRRVPFRVAE